MATNFTTNCINNYKRYINLKAFNFKNKYNFFKQKKKKILHVEREQFSQGGI